MTFFSARNDFTNNVSHENVRIKPGLNLIELKSKATRTGSWTFKQLSILIEKLEYLSESLPPNIQSFEITTKAASAVLSYKNLIAGIEQPIVLIISSGSFIFPPEANVVLKCSKHLKVREVINADDQDTENRFYKSEISIKLLNMKPFQELSVPLLVMCDLPGQRDEKQIDQKLTLQCPWSRNDIQIPLSFMPAMLASCRLHSSGTRKFLQVIVKGLESQLLLSNVGMTCDYKGVNLIDNNPKLQNDVICYKGLTVSYLWEIEVEPLKAESELSVIKVNFHLEYAHINDDVVSPIRKQYQCKFDVTDYTTLFRIQAKIEASELCRVGSVCHLNLKIIKMQENPFLDLMYEVLADQNTWAVVGRTAGVISMQDREAQSIMLEVLPLSAGFLPLPNIRLSKYISAEKTEIHPKLQPFPPGQIYNSTKSMQIHVLATANTNADGNN